MHKKQTLCIDWPALAESFVLHIGDGWPSAVRFPAADRGTGLYEVVQPRYPHNASERYRT